MTQWEIVRACPNCPDGGALMHEEDSFGARTICRICAWQHDHVPADMSPDRKARPASVRERSGVPQPPTVGYQEQPYQGASYQKSYDTCPGCGGRKTKKSKQCWNCSRAEHRFYNRTLKMGEPKKSV